MEILIIVLIVFYIVIFYFLKMRPEKQRKKEMEAMKRSLAPGVTMIDGIVGNICAVKEKTIVIETGADRVRLEYANWAIMNKGVAVDQAQQ